MESTSLDQKRFKYDVFLSFRGEDTRKNFVDHLYYALQQKGITTYKDDERIVKGEKIGDHLTRSIEESRFHIIVFSKNYASSSWCLDELVKIMECQKTNQQSAYPVFYDVEPTDVRNQSGAVGEAFANHVEKEGAGRWRDALKEAAGLAGWELKNTVDGHEAKFIQKIVKDISLKPHFISLSIDWKLVGMEARVKDVVSSLEIDSDDVRMIGIWGMGGVGKTTLARAVFDHISIWFEGKSFVENVREVSKSSLFGMKELQKQVLKDVLKDQTIDVTSVSDGKYMMKKMMHGRKVLLVLDDVDDTEQLEALAAEAMWFKPGSRIIITTRDEQVLVAHGVHRDNIQNVNLLSHEEAICLFSRHAFKKEIPNQGYEELSEKVVHYAAGLPLTIKVLGSHLCGRIECEWVDALERLKTIPLKQTLEKLELSYNGLESDQKEIFLEVACILKGEKKHNAIRILESFGLNAKIGLRVLTQKSLITFDDDDDDDDDGGGGYNTLLLHDHIEEMGMNIVRRLHPKEPNKHSRLWIKEEIEDILVNDLGTEATRSIMLDTDLHPAIVMKALKKMKELRYLHVGSYSKTLKLDEAGLYLPNTLQFLHWPHYPFWCLPKSFQANNLVDLEMKWSNISQLWDGGERKVLNKLRVLKLSYSNLRTFDLRMTPNLQTLRLKDCHDFVELHMPVECPKLEFLNLSGSKVSNLNLELAPNLIRLDLDGCSDFIELYMPVEYPKLKFLNLSGSKVSNLNLGLIPCLKRLYLGGCDDFVELHMPIECPKLEILDLSGSKVCNLNLEMAPNLIRLDLSKCNDFVELHMPVECPMLEFLNLSGSKVNNLNLGLTPCLKRLDLSKCYNLQEIYVAVGCLKDLAYLNLSGCLRFEYFLVNKRIEFPSLDSGATLELTVESLDICPLHPNSNSPKRQFKCKYAEPRGWSGNLEKLISLGVCACTNLESFSAIICGLQHLRELRLEGSIPEALIKDLYQLESLEQLTLSMKEIKHLPDSICMLKRLKYLELKSCWLLEQLPMDLGRLECLEELHLTNCMSLQDIPNSVCNMECLTRLLLPYCILVEKLPEELGCLRSLKVLDIEGAGISRLPQSIIELKGLCIVWSRGRLESYGFTSLKDISRYTASCYV